MPLSIRDIAISANEYARAHIQKGRTQIENNDLPEINKCALISGVMEVRSLILAIEVPTVEELYEKEIEIIKKYSLGNCQQLAEMALFYLITAHPDVYGQCYYLGNGDHVFLVIGKKKPSISMLLETWDKEAHVCDPWSNKVYPLATWKENLENYVLVAQKPLPVEMQEFQRQKVNYFKENKLILKKTNDSDPIVSRVLVYNNAGNCLGMSHFFHARQINTLSPLNHNHFFIPCYPLDSISLYFFGAMYRREKIRSMLILLRPFKDIFYATECLYQLLDEKPLLQENRLRKYLESGELLRQTELIKQSIYLLNNFKKYLLTLGDELELQEKCALPVADQLKEIQESIACLEQLLTGHMVQDVYYLDNTPIFDKGFSNSIKAILAQYPCPSSEKIIVETLLAGSEENLDSFVSYFYVVAKPTLNIKRNPIFDTMRGFFMSPKSVVNCARVVAQFVSYFYLVSKPTLSIKRNPIFDTVRGFFMPSKPVVNGARVAAQIEELIKAYPDKLHSANTVSHTTCFHRNSR